MPFTLKLDRRITKSGNSRPSKRPAKSRDFSVRCLGFLSRPERDPGPLAPLWIALCETRLALEPFVANLRSGWSAKSGRFDFAFPKEAGYRWSFREVARDETSVGTSSGAVSTIAIAYRPAYFALEPRGVQEHSMYTAEFILAPPSAWVEREARALAPRFGDDAREAVRAAHFAAYLDRRTPLPLLADLRFHLALFRAARQRGLIHECSETQLRSGLCGQGLEVCGFADPLFVRASCDEVAELITQETESFAKKENLHGSTLVSRTRGLFPDAVSTPAQHCFDFVVA